jgi:hypothetical protein
MDRTQIFIPFAKKDDEQRMVYGYASTEALDSQGEVVSKKAIMAALPDYMKYGNIREMHQPSAVGKTHQASMDDQGLFIKVKVVDDNAWKKVKEGVYNGFSIGGRVVTKIGNKISDLILSEISIVDRPANPEALFTVVKFDGSMKKDDYMEEIDTDSMKEHEMKLEELGNFMGRQVSIMEVSQILELARSLVYMICDRIWADQEYKDLESALDSLKSAAKVCLGDDQASEMSEKLDGIIEMVKVQKSNPEAYAYVDKEGKRYLPIANESLVKSAIKAFPLTNFHTEDHRILAARIIKSAAESLKIEVKDSLILKNADRAMQIEMEKEYTPIYRESGYFHEMRKVNG